MKKIFRFDELSDKRCQDCGIRLKKNLVARKPTAKMCYVCFWVRRYLKETSIGTKLHRFPRLRTQIFLRGGIKDAGS